MNQAHTVPPVAVPWTSPGKAPDGEAGVHPAAAIGEGRAVAEDPLDGLPCEGAQANAITATSAPGEIRILTTYIAYTPHPPRPFRPIEPMSFAGSVSPYEQ
jgi:hypothetical protein